jgi:hypothetical protein
MRQKHDHWKMARKAHHQKVLRKDASANVQRLVTGHRFLVAANGIGTVSEPKALGRNCCAKASLHQCPRRAFPRIFNFVLNFARRLP